MCEGGSQAGLWEVNQQTAGHPGRENARLLNGLLQIRSWGKDFTKISLGSKANELRERLRLGCACQPPVGRGMREVQGSCQSLAAFLGRGGSADCAIAKKGSNLDQEREGGEGLWVWSSCCGQAVVHHEGCAGQMQLQGGRAWRGCAALRPPLCDMGLEARGVQR